jgi:low affinity Fe/Cu permease
MTEPRHSLVRRITAAFSVRRIVVGVVLIWLITGAMFHFSHRWLGLLSAGTSLLALFFLFLFLTSHNRQVKTVSEKLNQVQDNLKKEEELLLRKLHTKHRNGDDA